MRVPGGKIKTSTRSAAQGTLELNRRLTKWGQGGGGGGEGGGGGGGCGGGNCRKRNSRGSKK